MKLSISKVAVYTPLMLAAMWVLNGSAAAWIVCLVLALAIFPGRR